jgi:hypothetical protein
MIELAKVTNIVFSGDGVVAKTAYEHGSVILITNEDRGA